jgi:exonuclease SbcD
MPISLIHVSDIHFGSGESHGRLNPETGLNIRFEDYVNAFSKVVQFAIDNKVDVFLFSGDAYKNSVPEPLYQKAFASHLKQLSDASIQTVLLVGNHDQVLKSTESHSMSVFQSLAVPNVTIIDKPQLIMLDTQNGKLQIVGLPYVTKHLLMTHEKYNDLPAASLDKILASHVRDILSGLYETLDPKITTIATAHVMLDRARAGAEQELMVGYTQTFPVDFFIDNRIDYVALGHVHKYQILRDSSPLIAYAGSLERVDFSEEFEDKGFIHLSVTRGHVDYKFHSISPRPFITVEADLTDSENPTEKLSDLVKQSFVKGCVLRVKYKVKEEQLSQVNENQIRLIVEDALSVRFKPELVLKEKRSRMPELNESTVLAPLDALDMYMGQFASDKKERLKSKAEKLISKLKSEDD